MPCETTEWSTVGSSYTPSFCKVEPLLHSIRGGLCPITNPITYIGGSDRTPLINISSTPRILFQKRTCPTLPPLYYNSFFNAQTTSTIITITVGCIGSLKKSSFYTLSIKYQRKTPEYFY